MAIEYKNKLSMVIGQHILGYERLAHQKLTEEYLPPSDEEVIDKYRNDVFFKRTVDSLIDWIINHKKQR